MGETALIRHRVRRAVQYRYLEWRTLRHPDIAMARLDALAPFLERRGWRCVKTYEPDVVPVRVPLLRVYGADIAVTLCVLAVPRGGWSYYEAARGRGGWFCPCGDAEWAAGTVDEFLRERSSAR
ncbi:hypothetical protein [Actinomadura chibensis]|uniref:DUF3024 domain-containing protein n=1 Tax=Actinomadura chibensis TaxID=392828 RepID=A0A5D0NYZ2_9ACTN|nr:hypothetical protein [Actinomadura chibensis]TYB49241.1 hypothetical protein FXF69_09045 [Actinomadura chibensis]